MLKFLPGRAKQKKVMLLKEAEVKDAGPPWIVVTSKASLQSLSY